MKHIMISANILRPIFHWLNTFKSVGDLIVRIFIAHVFFQSGLSKIQDWNTTMVLFKYVYSAPLMSPEVAAYIGTGAELILPVLLLLGLGGRIAILAFFIYNIVCVLSYHFLWTPAGNSGLEDHIMWGLLLMMLMFHGSGRFSLDHLIQKKFGHLIKTDNDPSSKVIHIA
jgi:putative oxidoreductase